MSSKRDASDSTLSAKQGQISDFFFFLMLDQLKAKYLPPPSSRLGAEGLFFHGH